MHVHVDQARIGLEKEHVGGMPVVVQHVGVGLADGMRDHLVAHEAAVDEEILRIARRAREAGRRHESGEADGRARGVDRDGRLREVLPHDAAGALPRRARREVRRAPPVVHERERHPGARQRQARERLFAARELRGLALQELPPRRRVVVELLHLDRRARGECGRLHRREAAPVARDPPGMALPGAAAGERQARNRADGRERLAAKPEGGRALEVLEGRDLAGGEARECQRQVVRLDSGAVVGDADAAHAALGQVHRDRLRAGVEAVLDQLLQRGRRALHHLARGDLVDQQFGERVDATHRGIAAGGTGRLWGKMSHEIKVNVTLNHRAERARSGSARTGAP